MEALIPTYNRLPVAFARGEGAWLYDEQGHAYLDGVAGIAVCGLGHSHPAIARVVAEQAQTLVHTSNLYRVPLQERLAERLCAAAGMSAAFFCNSGAEANEAAIKLARRHAAALGVGAPQIVVADGAFHGRTLGALAATGNPAAHEGFAPLPEGFRRVPYGDADAVAAIDDDAVCAVLVEPIQGEGGVRIPPADYLARLRRICDERGWLLMLDEVQTGMGRTGTLFAFEQAGIRPDVLILAKALGNGLPIGACLAAAGCAGTLGPGSHGTTYGGNPLAARAALAVLDTLEREDVPAAAERAGEALRARLSEKLAGVEGVREIRGRGLMTGIELAGDASALPRRALDAGLLINVTAGNVVRLVPPLILDDDEIGQLADGVADLVRRHLAGA
ncbi:MULTISPECIES: aspartate aminotransferase family protein [Halorhodospira]|uniref:aspartate aminotransferase family protein n=1 Tax=Halorhodospira TaxID=85108 RepID=UPI0019145F3C|nr:MULTISPECIES: aspartate aminotransferase family protein [Halorhodospira]MBK5935790.1 aspartate aminotransferase family protein [Halorhodospira halophila]MBK5943040.1 aspartate aminotransferase family protein [Halorhodospira halophila]MCG5528504.1 aspartate aminotransferase family protein [Halorhodospira halophila]MCG5537471.1 aspartate aminotransferase family protein [Halorhodospira sp. 9622]MCG5543833.1 aspartate aminotransferase family protein [Halorhodospira sp. 9628]